jgi:hypothetical protein
LQAAVAAVSVVATICAGCGVHRAAIHMGRSIPSLSSVPASIAGLNAPPLPHVSTVAWYDDRGKRCDALAVHWPEYADTCPRHTRSKGFSMLQFANHSANISCARMNEVVSDDHRRLLVASP